MASSSKKGKSQSPKRMRFEGPDATVIARKASEVTLPWEKIAPEYFIDWITVFSRAHGTTKEIMMMAVLPSVAGLLGAKTSLKLTDTYREKINVMVICVAPPCSGKSAATNHAGKIPLLSVEQYNKVRLLVDNFTHAGLTEQIILNDGIAICIKDELYSDIISEKSVGFLCRWYDGDSFYTTKGNNSAERAGVSETGLCLGGFIQVRNFMEELLPHLLTAEDGFLERILISVVRPEAMTRAETERFAGTLCSQYSDIQNLTEIYDAIYRDHNVVDPVEYTLSDEAKRIFDDHDAELCNKLNKQWSEGDLTNDETSIGKDRKNTLRLAVVLHALFFYIRRSIFKVYGPLPRVIGPDSIKCAIELTTYFRSTMNTISKLMQPEVKSTKKIFQEIVLKNKGSVVLVRNVRNRMSATSRPSIEDAVLQLQEMKDEGLGDVVSTTKTRAFIKHNPDRVNKDALLEYGIELDEYRQIFLAKDMELQPRHKMQILQISEIGNEVREFEEANKENDSSHSN